MKRFFCAFLTLIIILGCIPVSAASSPTDITASNPPSSDTDLPAPETEDSDAAADAEGSDAAPSTDYSDWDALIEAFFAGNNVDPETVTLAYYNTVTGEEHYFRGDEQMTAASVKKLPLNMYYAEKVADGEISLDETYYGGLPYRDVQEMSLRYSNNEYTEILIDAIGSYPDYRRAMCPYIGVAPDEMEPDFFTVNELSARQAMYCLKLLYSEPERYPGVMDNMLLATPGEYFEQTVTDYEIAQKYGWYVMDGHNCINCVGIVETEEPILLAIFTDNCRMGKNILGEYCSLMCEYTEQDIAARREAEAQRLAEEAEAQRLAQEEAARLAAEEEAARIEAEAEAQRLAEEMAAEAEAEKEEEMDNAENAIRVVVCIIACALMAAALGLVSRRKNKASGTEEKSTLARNMASAALGLVSIAAIIITISVCIRGLEARPVIMDEGSDPSERAEEFLSLVLSGESSKAEAMLLGSGKLGLEYEPEDEIGRMLYTALCGSFSYEKLGGGTEDSIDATERFSVTYLDIPSLTALQQEATNARLAEYLEAAERAEEVQAGDGSWLPEVAMRALEEVTAELLLDAESHYVTTELEIAMQYSGGEWKIIANEELFAILSGNTAY